MFSLKYFNGRGFDSEPFITLSDTLLRSILYFDLNKYTLNRDKKLIQIGQQLRKLSSIYLLNNISHRKLWLTGTKNYDKCKKLLLSEIKHFNIKEYMKFSFVGTTNRDFDIYPGPNDAGK